MFFQVFDAPLKNVDAIMREPEHVVTTATE